MKRGGLFFAAFLFISGALRIAGPGAAAPQNQQKEAPQKANSAGDEKNAPQIPYLKKFIGKIEEFYGVQESDSANPASLIAYMKAHKDTADPIRDEPVQFVIAILPDPVHTRLGLFFDRSAEALQQAAQMSNYVFDRAIMPWDRTLHTDASDLKTRQEQSEEQAQRESNPGLLIFRRYVSNVQGANSSPKGPLFVLVVGETPTAGLNKEQFRNAVKIIQEIQDADPAAKGAKKPPLLILGPSFSGSLESLEQELQQPDSDVQKISSERFIYSGTVTATDSMQWFEQKVGGDSHFASFQENDEYAQDEFLLFACDRGYQPNEIAVLSEDETVFGRMRSTDGQQSENAKADAQVAGKAEAGKSQTKSS